MKEWKIDEIIYCETTNKPIEIEKDYLGWYLFYQQVGNIWWKNGHYIYFGSSSDLTIDHKERNVLLFHILNDVKFFKEKYHRYLDFDIEKHLSELKNQVKQATTEHYSITVFNTGIITNDFTDKCYEWITKGNPNAKQR